MKHEEYGAKLAEQPRYHQLELRERQWSILQTNQKQLIQSQQVPMSIKYGTDQLHVMKGDITKEN